jgi:hypothetical protein
MALILLAFYRHCSETPGLPSGFPLPRPQIWPQTAAMDTTPKSSPDRREIVYPVTPRTNRARYRSLVCDAGLARIG